MTAPTRIQLRRTKGWRMPPNTVKVDRSTRWGNPFTAANSGTVPPVLRFACEVAPLLDLAPLRGKNLACWCAPGAECHADVLLRLANPIEPADHVHHAPSGEDWVVMFVRGAYLAPCGWPPCRAKVDDCTLIRKATPEERQRLLDELAANGRTWSDT